MAPLLAVDFPVLLHRAHARGHYPLLGAVVELSQIVKRYKPRAVAICIGQGAAQHRLKLDPNYHGKRSRRARTIQESLELAPDALERFEWQVYDSKTHEADDLLFSLARKEAAYSGKTVIVTQDKDLFAAVTRRTELFFLDQGLVDLSFIRARFGLHPSQMTDFIALAGDPADSIPGARGIGQKTAASLLRTHHTLAMVLDKSAALFAQSTELILCRELARLHQINVERPKDAQTDWDKGVSHLKALVASKQKVSA